MKIDIVARPGRPHETRAAQALRRGFERHGVAPAIHGGPDRASADIVACWGWRQARPFREAGRRVLVIEQGYVGDRLQRISLGWDGLNGRARFPLVGDGGRRWHDMARQIGVGPQWRSGGGDFALVLGQVPGDAATEGVDLAAWYANAVRRLAELTGLPVMFRPHPVHLERAGPAAWIDGAAPWRGSLADGLARAAAVAAYNSNGLTDAALAGVPVLAGDAGAMAWPVAGRGMGAEPQIEDRRAWLHRLAWCQWHHDEIASGAAWTALRGAIDPGTGWSPSRGAVAWGCAA